MYLLGGLKSKRERTPEETDVEVEDELIRAMREDIEKVLVQEGCTLVYAEGVLQTQPRIARGGKGR